MDDNNRGCVDVTVDITTHCRLFPISCNSMMNRKGIVKFSTEAAVSDTGPRLADYSGTQYYFISGKTTPADGLEGPAATGLNLGRINIQDDDEEKETMGAGSSQNSGKGPKGDHTAKEAKVTQ